MQTGTDLLALWRQLSTQTGDYSLGQCLHNICLHFINEAIPRTSFNCTFIYQEMRDKLQGYHMHHVTHTLGQQSLMSLAILKTIYAHCGG